MRIKANKAYKPLFANKDRYLVLKGSAGSGKSVFAAQKIIARTITERGHRFLVVRKVARTVEESVWAELRKVISQLGITNEFIFNKTVHKITHAITGNEILCMGLDDPEKIKSINSPTGGWVEEATELSQDDFNQLDTRIRGTTKHYKQWIISFNPVSKKNWVYPFFFEQEWPIISTVNGNTITTNAKIVETTYRDNPYLTDEDVASMMLKAKLNPNYKRVYLLGEWGQPDIDDPFMYNFTEDIIAPVEVIKGQPLYLSFDFNVNPITCSVHQYGYDFYHTIDEFRISNSTTEDLCEHIKGRYPGYAYRVTGDASGNSRNTQSHYTNFEIIQRKLNPLKIDLPRKNPPISESRTISNAIIKYYPNRRIDPKCEHLIEDLRLVRMNKGNIDKTKDSRQTHLLDTLRYMDYTYNGDFITKRMREFI